MGFIEKSMHNSGSFQAKKRHQAAVLGPNGLVTGLINVEDILEQLVGSIQDEHD